MGRSALDSFRAGLGLRVEERCSGKLAPQLAVRWAHEHGQVRRDVDAAFVGTAQSFRVNGRSTARDSLQMQAGAQGRIGKRTGLEVAYINELASGQATHGGFARAVWRW